MIILAVIILRVVAWFTLGIGLITTCLLVLGATTIIRDTTYLPPIVQRPALDPLTILIIVGFLTATLFYWAILICIASIADDLQDLRFRQR